MQLDKDFVKNLTIPFDAAMPHGALGRIRDKLNLSNTAPTKILSGEWTNEEVVKEALKEIILEHFAIEAFLKQFPQSTTSELIEEINKKERLTPS